MLMWWLTSVLSCRTALKVLSRVFLSSLITTLSPATTPTSATMNGTTVATTAVTQPTTFRPTVSDLVQGVYEYRSSSNFEDYLRELGVSYILRKLAALASPTVTITRNECPETAVSFVFLQKLKMQNANPFSTFQSQTCKDWTVSTSTVFRNHQVSFNLDEPTVDTTMDGRNVRMTVTQSGPNTWTEMQVGLDADFKLDPRGKTTQLVRRFFQDQMTVDLSVGSVRSSSNFRRINWTLKYMYC